MDEHWTALLHLLIQGGSRTATFDLGSSMTSEGLLLETAIVCTITGPMLPLLLVKVPITGAILLLFFLLPPSSVSLLPFASQCICCLRY